MKKIFLSILILIFSLFSQELNKKQLRQYRSQRIVIETYGLTSSYNTTEYSSVGTVSTRWFPKISNKRIDESEFYSLVNENDYYLQANQKENLLHGMLISSIGLLTLGAVIMIVGFNDTQTVGDSDIYQYTTYNQNTVNLGLILTTTSLIPAFYGYYLSFQPSIVDLNTAKELAEEYNLSLKLKISKKF